MQQASHPKAYPQVASLPVGNRLSGTCRRVAPSLASNHPERRVAPVERPNEYMITHDLTIIHPYNFCSWTSKLLKDDSAQIRDLRYWTRPL